MWFVLDTWIVIIGALCAAACAIPGTFLVLRKMSMMGDAISHAVLPGLALGFILTGARTSITMFVGALIAGILTALFTHWISRFGKVEHGASMGIVFTSLFALGLLLIAHASHRVDLDPDCVLFGAIELAPLDIVTVPCLPYWEIPRAAITLGVVLILNAGVVGLLYKEFKISAFDPDLATTLGIHAGRMHDILMVMVAITTVAAFEAVGSIIVIAMLIVPAATARLLTERIGVMLLLATVIGIASALLGHVAAIFIPPLIGFESTSSAGMMATVTGILFLFTCMAARMQMWRAARASRLRSEA